MLECDSLENVDNRKEGAHRNLEKDEEYKGLKGMQKNK